MQRIVSEEHALRSGRAARQQVTVESSKVAAEICQSAQAARRKGSSGDDIPAGDRARGEECKGMLHGRCTALLVEESCSEEAKMVAAVRRLTVHRR